MTHKVGSFYDPLTAGQRMIDILHPDLIANGWVREEVNIDSGAWRWDVYRNPAANNSNGIEFYIGLGRYFGSGTAGVGDMYQTVYFTVFEQWNSTTKQATNFPVFGAAILGTNANGIPIYATTPRPLPSETTQPLAITAVNVTNPGSGYTIPPTVTFSPVNLGSGAAASAVMELGQVTLGAGGTGYPASQTSLACTVTGGGGTGAIVTATTNGSGAVTGYSIVDRGTGFTTVPTITVSGGGTGATSTVTLRVKQCIVTSNGSTYTLGATVNFGSGGGGSGAVANATTNSGFAYFAENLGQSSTHYFYTITPDMLALSIRRDGSADSGGVYVGTYDRMLTPAQDVMPIGVIGLGSSSNNIRPFDGFGFSTREPFRGAVGPSAPLINDCALLIRQGGGAGIINTASVPSVYNASGGVASGSEFVSRTYFCGRGSTTFVRGLLKNVVYAPLPTYSHGDLLYVQQGSTVRYARFVNTGHALMII